MLKEGFGVGQAVVAHWIWPKTLAILAKVRTLPSDRCFGLAIWDGATRVDHEAKPCIDFGQQGLLPAEGNP